MANPIPTLLSPGVNVSEIDLSTFVQPVAGNIAGMAGVFNWGPALVSRAVSSESELASIFGKPTLDASDVMSETDFLAAANFLRYSNNLRVVRAAQATDYNSVSVDAGITGINSVTHKTLINEDQFIVLGGFSGEGIEPVAHFRARYPGNFGDSLRVLAYDSATTDQYQDYILPGGYTGTSITGVVIGSIGLTFNIQYSDTTDPNNPTTGIVQSQPFTFPYYIVRVSPVNGETPEEFISNLPSNFEILYATGTTAENYALGNSGDDPSGNNANYYSLKQWNTNLKFNPFKIGGDQPLAPKNVLAKKSSVVPGCVDLMFLDMDYSSSGLTMSIGATFGSPNRVFTNYVSATRTGIPTNFDNLFEYFGGQAFDVWRNNWSRIDETVFGTTFNSVTGLRGWSMLVGFTGNRIFSGGADGSTVSINFDPSAAVSLATIRNDFRFGMKQFGQSTTKSTLEGRGSGSEFRIFDKLPTTSAYAAARGGSNDEISFAVLDAGGKFGPKNSVLEKFELLSKATDAKNLDGESIYYKDYINNNSQYVYMTKAFGLSGGGAYNSDASTAFGDMFTAYRTPDGNTFYRYGYYDARLEYGQSATADATNAEKIAAYNIFADDESAVDILFVPESSVPNDNSTSTTVLEQSIYDQVIEPRKDTIFVVPTPKPAATNQFSSISAAKTVAFRNTNLTVPSNSYTVLVTGRKLYFDPYNNQTRRISLSSDVAGIMCAQEIPWESPAGFARGTLKNIIKLETNFTKTDRDELYKNQINCFNEFTDGSGTVLFGDKTLLRKASAFDRINVRRVFIAIEKAIARAAKYSLFEFNDEFTRSQFRNLVIPFLRNIVSQRGISDFKVVCDETNNTAQVIDSNQFVADIYIKPLKSINFIQLNFIAVKGDFNLSVVE